MAVVGIAVTATRPFADGEKFGGVGSYQRLDGVMSFAVDPDHPENRSIVDLALAPRDAEGLVHFEADFCLMQPDDATRGNRRLLYQVANRGRIGAVPFNFAPTPAVLSDSIDPGDGFLMRNGWSVLWVGWQWDVVRRPGYLGLVAPQAMDGDRPIAGQVVRRFQPNEPHACQLLASWPLDPPPGNPEMLHAPYPALDVNDATATLTVRNSHTDEPRPIDRDQWRFARMEAGAVVSDDTYVWLTGDFQPGLVYELIYTTRLCPVAGTGLLSMRDAVSFVRYGTAAEGNPMARRIDWTIGYGVSQSGRYLREYLYHGLNLDEVGRQVFDGLIPHVAGARRGEFNHRYAQPSTQHQPGFGQMFPFADVDLTDRVTGQTDGLLTRQRVKGGVPKIFTTNTSSEYWRIDASLIHTDLDATRDIEPSDDVRIYLLAGTQHGPGTLPLVDQTLSGARGAHNFNTVDYAVLMRALLDALGGWISTDEEPPASAFPRLSDGTAETRENVLAKFGGIPGVTLPDVAALPRTPRIDIGPEMANGIGRWPATLGPTYPCVVSAVDADGNEVAGLRLPDLTVPLGSHTGWVPRHPSTGGTGQIVDMQGSTIPLIASVAGQKAAADPRPAIAARYRDRDDYLLRVRRAAESLVGNRFLLREDVERVVTQAGERFDVFAADLRLARV